MFNKYNLIIVLILLSSFVFGYKGDVISSRIKNIFSKKESAKTEVAIPIATKEESSVNPEIVNSNPLSAVAPPLVSSRPQPETLGKTLDSISAGSISEEQLRKHQEYLNNITTKLKDFQGGEENVPPLPAVSPTLPDFAGAKPSAVNNGVIQPVQTGDPLSQPAPGSNFEQQTPLTPQGGTDVEEEDSNSEDEEVDDDSSDDEDPDEEDTTEDDTEVKDNR